MISIFAGLRGLTFFLAALLPSIAVGAERAAPGSGTGSRPNIIFILTDDQGYGDVSAHGNPVLRTPNLDRLYAESVRFTDFHVSPTCAPTRSALLTGRHEFKNGVTHTIFERERLTPTATTLAQVLKAAGYTTGIFGKWHLGDEAEYQPERRGFDEVFIHGGGGIGQVYPGSCGDAPRNTYFNPAILHNGTFERTQGYCTDVFFAQALRWIATRKDLAEPFYAHIATNAPHAPLQVRPEDEARYAGKVLDAATAKYFGMVANIDDNVGRLLDQLDAWGLRERTLIVFMNDNGGTGGVKVFNAGMRGQKGSPWLGGTRAASFWRWPGHLQPRDVAALTAHVDFFPTLAALAQAKLSPAVQAQVEGRSLVPLLTDPSAGWPDRTLFTHVGRWARFANPDDSKFTQCAVRTPRWHLVSIKGGTAPAWELFDLTADPSEKTNVAAAHPAVVAQLAREYDAWWIAARAGMVNEQAVGPRLNPFAARFWKQFGGGPDADDLRIMEPTQRTVPKGRGAVANAP
jgi:arylsulfatase